MKVLLDRQRTTEKLEDDIRRQIETAVLKEGDRILPERELCKTYNLSRGSVKKILKHLAREGLLKRNGRQGTFVNVTVSSLKKTRSKTIVFCFYPSSENNDLFSHSYFYDIYRGMEEETKKLGWDIAMQIRTPLEEKSSEKEVNNAHWADGIVVAGTGTEIISFSLKNRAFPFVLVDYPQKTQNINCIYPDNIKGGYLATSHLLKLGHRKIGFIYPRYGDEKDMQEGYKTRFYGYLDGLNEYKIPVEEKLLLGIDTGSHYVLTAKGEKELRNYLLSSKRPDAIFTTADDIVPEIYRIAGELGLTIPGDLSIVGFDGLSIGEKLKPALTTINVDREKMGRFAVHRLKSIFEGETEQVSHVLPVELTVRASTSSPCYQNR